MTLTLWQWAEVLKAHLASDILLMSLINDAPTTNLATGIRIQGRKCEKILCCYGVNKDEFWRYAKLHSRV